MLEYGAGLFPSQVGWRKATAAGRLADGRPLALQLVDGLSVSGADDGADDVLLIGAGPVPLPPVVVELDPGTATAPCRILSPDGSVDLTFQPVAVHRDTRGLLLVSLATTQLVGELAGTLPGPAASGSRSRGWPACSRTAQPGGRGPAPRASPLVFLPGAVRPHLEPG